MQVVVVFAVMLYAVNGDDEYQQSSHVKKLSACSMAQISRSLVTATEAGCKHECLKTGCAAFQWHAEPGNCEMQDTLHLTPSSDKANAVTVLTVKCAMDCADILAQDPASPSGGYPIIVHVNGWSVKRVYCDMDTDGGGWTVFLKRENGTVDFYGDRGRYKAGFGDVQTEYWLGLDALHAITSLKAFQVRSDMEDWEGLSAYSLHEEMMVNDESTDYRLTVSSLLEGTAGAGLRVCDGKRFSTPELDLDGTSSANIAEECQAGWWFDTYRRVLPTGRFYAGGHYSATYKDGIEWKTWSAHDDFYSLKTLQLKLRP